LDYAANAVHWKVETLQSKFELTCAGRGVIRQGEPQEMASDP